MEERNRRKLEAFKETKYKLKQDKKRQEERKRQSNLVLQQKLKVKELKQLHADSEGYFQ